MARLWSSGFELNSIVAGVESSAPAITGTGVHSTQAVTVRSGGFAWKGQSGITTGGGAELAMVYSPANSTGRTQFWRWYVRIHTLPTTGLALAGYVTDNTSAKGGEFLITTAGVLTLNTWTADAQIGSTGPTLVVDTWYRMEMSQVFTSNVWTGYVDGVQFATGTGDTACATNKMFVSASGPSPGVANYEVYYDDLACNDDTGSFQNTLPGAGKIIQLNPSAAGDVNTFATQTGGTAGAANNFTRVNNIPPDDATTFNGSSTLNEHDLFNAQDSGIGASDVVNVVAVGGRFRNSTADVTGSFKFEIEKTGSGTKSQSTAIIPNSVTWRTNATSATVLTYPITLYQDPDASAWTQTTLDSMQIGYIDSAAPGTAGRRCDVSNVWALVDYTPAVVANPIGRDITNLNNNLGAVVFQARTRGSNY